jgi:hypothetical protein
VTKFKIDAYPCILCPYGVYEKRWWGWKCIYHTPSYKDAKEFLDNILKERQRGAISG